MSTAVETEVQDVLSCLPCDLQGLISQTLLCALGHVRGQGESEINVMALEGVLFTTFFSVLAFKAEVCQTLPLSRAGDVEP